MSSQDLTLKDYQKQLKDNVRNIQDKFAEILNTKSEHVTFEVQIRAAEIVRSFQSLMTLIADIRNFYIINDFTLINQSIEAKSDPTPIKAIDEKLVQLRDDMAVLLYDLEATKS